MHSVRVVHICGIYKCIFIYQLAAKTLEYFMNLVAVMCVQNISSNIGKTT